MKHCFVLIICLALSSVIKAQDGDEYAIPDQYIVQLNGGVDGPKFFGQYPEMKIKKCLSKSMNIWLMQSAAGDMLTTLRKSPSVKVAQHNHDHIQRRQLVPNDSLFNLQWNMLNTGHPGADISATEAWQLNHSNVTKAGDSIVIAVVDGGGIDGDSASPGITTAGFDIYHPDLNFFINHHEIPNNGIDDDSNGYVDDYLGWSVFSDNDSIYNVTDPHSTHVSGIAGAKGNNSIGVAGVCWGPKILGVVGASNYESDVVNAYDYVLSLRKLYDRTGGAKGAFIVATNSSFGVGDYGAHPVNYPIWCAMYDSLGAYGILSAIAVPDAAVNVDQVGDVPTGCPSRWMIAVTNTTNTDGLNSQAGYGATTVDIGAPGSSIMSCYPNNSYGYDNGTSMSSPHLAGAVAAVFANACPGLLQAYSVFPDSIALLMKNYLFQSVDPLTSLQNITTTGGRLDLYQAFVAEDSYDCNGCNYPATLSQQSLSCYGDSTGYVKVSAGSDSAAYHYLWATGDTTATVVGLRAGLYQVTVTDTTGCQRLLSALITQPPPITINSVAVNPIGTNYAGNIIVNATAQGDTLTYAIDSGSYGTSAIFVVDSPGVHIIYIRTQSGCVQSVSVGIYYLGIALAGNEINEVTLSPNPVSGVGTLIINAAADMNAELMIHDLTGRQIINRPMQTASGLQREAVDLSGLSQGLYILTLASQGRTLASLKVTVVD